MTQKIQNLNRWVLHEIKEARDAGRAIHGYHIRRWGLERADELNISRSYFSASDTWLYKLKKCENIGSRKVTEYISRSQNCNQDIIDERIDRFLSDYETISPRYPRRLIINMDQTGFNYEYADQRTLSFIGERDTRVNIDQRNKMTHSFSAQPMITRDGRLFGKLLLIMQESKNEFGPQISQDVRDFERNFKNVKIFPSKSGKMRGDLFLRWVEEVLNPAIRGTLTSLDTDTDIGSDFETLSMDDDAFEECRRIEPMNITSRAGGHRKPHTLLIADSFTGQSGPTARNELTTRGVEFLQIPPGTTKYIQPLDFWFNRQDKQFVSAISRESDDPRSGVAKGYLTSRGGVINTHSLIWDQFQSEVYTDMLRYAWHNTDPH